MMRIQKRKRARFRTRVKDTVEWGLAHDKWQPLEEDEDGEVTKWLPPFDSSLMGAHFPKGYEHLFVDRTPYASEVGRAPFYQEMRNAYRLTDPRIRAQALEVFPIVASNCYGEFTVRDAMECAHAIRGLPASYLYNKDVVLKALDVLVAQGRLTKNVVARYDEAYFTLVSTETPSPPKIKYNKDYLPYAVISEAIKSGIPFKAKDVRDAALKFPGIATYYLTEPQQFCKRAMDSGLLTREDDGSLRRRTCYVYTPTQDFYDVSAEEIAENLVVKESD